MKRFSPAGYYRQKRTGSCLHRQKMYSRRRPHNRKTLFGAGQYDAE